MTPRGLALGFVLALGAASCGGANAPSPSASPDLGPATYTLCPPSGELPPADENDAMVEVVEARLAAMGVSGEVSLGRCVDVSVAGVAEDDALRAVLFGSGFAEVVAVPANRIGEIAVGDSPPDGLTAVLDSSVFVGAWPDADAVVIELSDGGASLLATWTTTHVGQTLALVLDGRIVGGAIIDGRAEAGALRIPVSAETGLTPSAVAALLSAGPLPGDWRQPDAPQG